MKELAKDYIKTYYDSLKLWVSEWISCLGRGKEKRRTIYCCTYHNIEVLGSTHLVSLFPSSPSPHLSLSLSLSSALSDDYEQKLQSRIHQVCQEIDEKGHYNLTYEELTYGARLAWRNAPRCVNRIIWRQLEVTTKRVAMTKGRSG